jgi:hypothetical protein
LGHAAQLAPTAAGTGCRAKSAALKGSANTVALSSTAQPE